MDWTLSEAQRESLRHQMRTTSEAGVCRRCLALLRLDQGEVVATVSREMAVSRQTLYNWRERLRSSGADPMRDAPRSGRPPIWTDKRVELLKQLLSQSPRSHGFQAGGWTLRLLRTHLDHQHQCQVSRSSLRKKLHQLGYVWKRFRYTLKPDPQREKKKTYPQANQELAGTGGSSVRG